MSKRHFVNGQRTKIKGGRYDSITGRGSADFGVAVDNNAREQLNID